MRRSSGLKPIRSRSARYAPRCAACARREPRSRESYSPNTVHSRRAKLTIISINTTSIRPRNGAAETPDVGEQIASVEIGRATSELQSLMRISYAVFCLKKKKQKSNKDVNITTIGYHTEDNTT